MIDRHSSPGAAILARFLPSDIEESVMGDLDETFHRIATLRGRLLAQIWLVAQVATLTPKFFLFHLQTLEPWRIFQ
ncbi:MAG: hypothetical protein ACRDFQ_06900 [Anaerolineales bacterium]